MTKKEKTLEGGLGAEEKQEGKGEQMREKEISENEETENEEKIKQKKD